MTQQPNSTAGVALPPALPAPVIAYATPVSSVAQGWGVWQDDKMVVASKGAVLPHACVKCGGAPAAGRALRKTFYWHTPGLYVLILFPGLLVYAIVALIVRQSGLIEFSLCDLHRRRRLTGLLLAWLLIPGGLAALIGGAVTEYPAVAVLGVVAFIVGIVGAYRAQTLRPGKIDAHYLWLKGASPAFLSLLPGVVRG